MSTPPMGSMFMSGFLNPVPPPPPSVALGPGTNPAMPGQQMMTAGPAPMMAAAPASMMTAAPAPIPALPIVSQAQFALMQEMHADLESKLTHTVEKVKTLETQKRELLDRLEKALLVAAKLKDAETDNIELRARVQATEKELRRLAQENEALRRVAEDKSVLLTDVREKYFAERRRAEGIAGELEVANTVGDMAKRELDNAIAVGRVRDTQVMTMRNLVETGYPISTGVAIGSQGSVSGFGHPFSAVAGDDELARSSVLGSANLQVMGIPPTPWHQWQLTPSAPLGEGKSEFFRRLLLSQTMSGLLHDNRVIAVFIASSPILSSTPSFERELTVTVTNVSAATVRSVRVLNANKPTSAFEWSVRHADECSLRPGESMRVETRFVMKGIWTADSAATTPTICVSYTQAGSTPSNTYLPIPLCVLKFVVPVNPASSALFEKWKSFIDSERVAIIPTSAATQLSALSVLAECGGSLLVQKGIDLNPRGFVVAGALPNGQHGCVKEVMARIELTPADHRGIPQVRVAVRTPTIGLSQSVLSTLLTLLVSAGA